MRIPNQYTCNGMMGSHEMMGWGVPSFSDIKKGVTKVVTAPTKAVIHTVAETGRGVADLDPLRVFAAPIKGVSHGVAETARGALLTTGLRDQETLQDHINSFIQSLTSNMGAIQGYNYPAIAGAVNNVESLWQRISNNEHGVASYFTTALWISRINDAYARAAQVWATNMDEIMAQARVYLSSPTGDQAATAAAGLQQSINDMTTLANSKIKAVPIYQTKLVEAQGLYNQLNQLAADLNKAGRANEIQLQQTTATEALDLQKQQNIVFKERQAVQKFNPTSLILPAALIGGGFLAWKGLT